MWWKQKVMGSLIIKNYCIGEREAKMQAVGLEPTRANTLRPERSTLDHSVTLALVHLPNLHSIKWRETRKRKSIDVRQAVGLWMYCFYHPPTRSRLCLVRLFLLYSISLFYIQPRHPKHTMQSDNTGILDMSHMYSSSSLLT